MAERVKEEKRVQEKERRKTERELQGEGKKPFFLKKCEWEYTELLNVQHDVVEYYF